MNIPKVRIQIMFSQEHINMMQMIDEEFGGKLNPSKIIAYVFDEYRKWRKIAKLYEGECRKYEEKIKNIEYELRQKIKTKEANE